MNKPYTEHKTHGQTSHWPYMTMSTTSPPSPPCHWT